MTQTIKCLYTCTGCGLKEQSVQVPSCGDEDVLDWFRDTLTPALAKDHTNRSPLCMSREMSEVRIPIDGSDKIGGVQG